MRVESQITIARPREEVFDYLAHGERLPEYMTDFASVQQTSSGEPSLGTEYSYRMARGQAASTFAWSEFQRPSRLAWHGPPAKAGPGSMEPSGWWELSESGDETNVKLVMTPKPGGLFVLLAPLMSIGMRKGGGRTLQQLKRRLEQG